MIRIRNSIIPIVAGKRQVDSGKVQPQGRREAFVSGASVGVIESSLPVTKASHRQNDSSLDQRINVHPLGCASWVAGRIEDP